MKSGLLKLVVKVRTFMREDGQDLVEYALVIGLLVLAATAGTRNFASKLSNAFNNMGTAISNDVG